MLLKLSMVVAEHSRSKHRNSRDRKASRAHPTLSTRLKSFKWRSPCLSRASAGVLHVFPIASGREAGGGTWAEEEDEEAEAEAEAEEEAQAESENVEKKKEQEEEENNTKNKQTKQN